MVFALVASLTLICRPRRLHHPAVLVELVAFLDFFTKMSPLAVVPWIFYLAVGDYVTHG